MRLAQVTCWMGLGWERLENFRLKQLAVLMYKIHNNLSPLYLKQIFNNISTVHTYNLRNSESNYYIPRPRTEYGKGSLHYRGSVLCLLDVNTKEERTVSLFKKLNWMPLYDEINVNKLCLIFKCLNGQCPEYLCNKLWSHNTTLPQVQPENRRG